MHNTLRHFVFDHLVIYLSIYLSTWCLLFFVITVAFAYGILILNGHSNYIYEPWS